MSIAPYSYSKLNDDLKKVAMKELNENPDQVNAHIESLRRWVRSMPHLQCPLDSDFLIQFLRVAKFEHSKAQARLDNFCTVRASPRGNPAWFRPMGPNDALVEKALDIGQLIFLGISDRGETVWLNRPGQFNPEGPLPMNEYVAVIYTVIDSIAEIYPNMSIVGSSMFMDLSGVDMRHMKMFSDQAVMKETMKVWQDAYPVRSKDIVYYKEPVIFDVMFKMVEFWIKPKLRKRLHRVKDNLQKVYEIIPGMKRILPAEYGGTNGTIESLRKNMKSIVQAYLAKQSRLYQIKVDETKRPESTLKFLRQYGDFPADSSMLSGTKGTYTKLDV